jgi:hypothetical protein
MLCAQRSLSHILQAVWRSSSLPASRSAIQPLQHSACVAHASVCYAPQTSDLNIAVSAHNFGRSQIVNNTTMLTPVLLHTSL